MQKIPVEVTIKFDLPCDDDDHVFKFTPAGAVSQLVFDDVTNYLICKHLEDALTWMAEKSPNAKNIAESHKFWADILKGAKMSIKTPTLTRLDPHREHKKVVAAAILSSVNNKVYSLPAPARHHDVIRHMIHDHGLPRPAKGTQGFVLDDGRFVDRMEAKKLAKAAGQLLARASKSEDLFSEDVW